MADNAEKTPLAIEHTGSLIIVQCGDDCLVLSRDGANWIEREQLDAWELFTTQVFYRGEDVREAINKMMEGDD